MSTESRNECISTDDLLDHALFELTATPSWRAHRRAKAIRRRYQALRALCDESLANLKEWRRP